MEQQDQAPEEEATPDPAPRPFFEVLRELRHGATLEELAEELQDLVATVKDTGKAGSLTLKITLKPASRNDTTTVMLEDEVTIKQPKRDRSATIMFTTNENGLSRKDPRQRELELREVVDRETGELRTVS